MSDPTADPDPADLATALGLLERRAVYSNPWISVVEDDVELPNGHRTLYGIVRMNGAVGVLPFVDDHHVVMVRQYRYVVGRATWEMPTGGVHDGEELVVAAQRELGEEVGFRAGRLDHLASFDSSKSVVDETCHLYLARDLEPVVSGIEPDETELIRVETLPFDAVRDMVLSGEITDAMTVIAVLLADRAR